LPENFDVTEGFSISETEKYIVLENGLQANTGIIYNRSFHQTNHSPNLPYSDCSF